MPTSTISGSFYGYRDDYDRLTQLQEVLGFQLKPVQMQSLKDELTSLTYKHIDPQGHKAQYQRKALEEIDNELCKKFPEIFRGEEYLKKLYYARRVVLYIDKCRRLKPAPEAEAGSKNNVLTGEKSDAKKSAMEFIDLTIESDSEATSSSAGRGSNQGSSKKHPLDDIKGERPVKMAKCEKSMSKHALKSLTKGTEKIKEEEMAESSDFPTIDPDTSFLRHFLSKCKPPMDHLLPAFKEFGCFSETHLRSISRQWSEDKRQNLLRKILVGNMSLKNGHLVREMDVEVVDYYLREYL